MKIAWDKAGERFYETGVSQVVLYPKNPAGQFTPGVPWNGVSNVSEKPSGAEASPVYANNTKYLNLMSVEELSLSIEAYTYPDEFAQCDGSDEVEPGIRIGQQSRKEFGLSYKTQIGNDADGSDHGYKLHLAYNGLAAPSERSYATINDTPEAMALSWEVTTTPVSVPGYKPTALLTIDSTKVNAERLKALEDVLYGKDEPNTEPRLPLPEEVLEIMQTGAG